MQKSVNATAIAYRLAAALQSIRAAATAVPHGYTVSLPGAPLAGPYPTSEAAETALCSLPPSIRQHAAICDLDGIVLAR